MSCHLSGLLVFLPPMKTRGHESKTKSISLIRRAYNLSARRACSIIILGALFCTMAVKFFHSYRLALVNEYVSWILADIAVLLGIEIVLTSACFRWPRRRVIRTALVLAAVVCTWSVMNAGWLIRTGTQILPRTCVPLIRDPIIALGIVGVNLTKMPIAAVVLLGPSAVALTFFFAVLSKASPPDYNRKHFLGKISIFCVVILIALLARTGLTRHGSVQILSAGLHYNSQLKALMVLLPGKSSPSARNNALRPRRTLTAFDEINVDLSQNRQQLNYNLVIVVLEGVQYRYTSLADKQSRLTPYLETLAQQGVEFTNFRSSLTHTTKALFSLFTGKYSSVSQDLAETVPVAKPYAGIVTILKQKMDYRSAFFQSAKGNFEARPALVHNLGFDKFWARENLNDPNSFLGYLACDEFAMLKPITEWIKADGKPFVLTILCSVTHDPYEVPQWFDTPAKEPLDRYKQSILYTDKFIAALDAELARLNLTDRIILCIIGDHGEEGDQPQ